MGIETCTSLPARVSYASTRSVSSFAAGIAFGMTSRCSTGSSILPDLDERLLAGEPRPRFGEPRVGVLVRRELRCGRGGR